MTLFLFIISNALWAQDTTGIIRKLKLCYDLNKQRDSSLTTEAKKLLPIAKKLPKSDEAVRIYTLIGRGFLHFRELDSCPKYFKLAYKNLSSRVSADAEAHLNLSSGWTDYASGKTGLAMQKYQNAFLLYGKVGDPVKTAWVLNNMTQIMSLQNNYVKALEYAQAAVDITSKSSDSLTYAYNTQTLGEVYVEMGNPKEALIRYRITERILTNAKIWTELALIYIKINRCYYLLKQYDLAIKNGLIADSLIKTYNIKFYTGFNSSYLADSYLALNDIPKSIYHIERALADFKKGDIDDFESDVYYQASIIYNKVKQFDKALYYLKLYTKVSMVRNDTLSKISETGQLARFDLLVKEREVENLKTLNEQQKEIAAAQDFKIKLITVFTVLLVVVLLFFVWLVRRAKLAESSLFKQQLITEYQNKELKKQNELQLMTIGIVGHDLRGPLSSVVTLKTMFNNFLDSGDIKNAQELSTHLFYSLDRINKLANNLVEWVLSAQSGINLNFSEIQVLDLVTKVSNGFLSELREKNITLQNKVAVGTVIYADASSVETILRNVIQNAIKFTPDGKRITITSLISDSNPDFVTISVIDEGKGMPTDVLDKLNSGKRMITVGTKGEKGNGLGLIMIQTLLSLNKGTIKISSEIGVGTSFSVLLPSQNLNK